MIVYKRVYVIINTMFITCLNTMSTVVVYNVADIVYKHEWI